MVACESKDRRKFGVDWNIFIADFFYLRFSCTCVVATTAIDCQAGRSAPLFVFIGILPNLLTLWDPYYIIIMTTSRARTAPWRF